MDSIVLPLVLVGVTSFVSGCMLWWRRAALVSATLLTLAGLALVVTAVLAASERDAAVETASTLAVSLLLVLVALAGAGSWLLDLFGVPESGSTSLLAVGIMAVLVMVFLLGSLDAWWAAIAIPVTAVVGYAVSWWVTNAVVGDDTDAEVAEPHDVR